MPCHELVGMGPSQARRRTPKQLQVLQQSCFQAICNFRAAKASSAYLGKQYALSNLESTTQAA